MIHCNMVLHVDRKYGMQKNLNLFRELYAVALENDASCVEALYNLGLCNKKLGMYEDALEVFFKLQTIVRNHSQVKDNHN